MPEEMKFETKELNKIRELTAPMVEEGETSISEKEGFFIVLLNKDAIECSCVSSLTKMQTIRLLKQLDEFTKKTMKNIQDMMLKDLMDDENV